MNTRAGWQFGILTAANVWVAFAIIRACQANAFLWKEMLPSHDLPVMTTIALRLAPWLARGLIIVSLIGLVWAIRDRARSQILPALFNAALFSEIACLGFYLWALTLPLVNVTYTIAEPGAPLPISDLQIPISQTELSR